MTPWTVARQFPLSMGFSRQEYWSGLPFPPSGDLPDPGIKRVTPVSLVLAGRFFTTAPPILLQWCPRQLRFQPHILNSWKAQHKTMRIHNDNFCEKKCNLIGERDYIYIKRLSSVIMKLTFIVFWISGYFIGEEEVLENTIPPILHRSAFKTQDKLQFLKFNRKCFRHTKCVW